MPAKRPAGKPLTNILVKPAGPDCNLACEYCFYIEKEHLFRETRVHRMSDEVLEEMVRQMMTLGGVSVAFGWQGGEPTLMGLDFFRRAVEFQKRYGYDGQTVGNGIQTNGVLISDEWCEFLREYSVLVGLSLDGPQHVHDHYRKTRNGKPTWELVTASARRMMDRGVDVNALVVVSDYSAKYPREIYEYLVEFGFTFLQFIPCVEPDPHHPDRCAPFSVSGEGYGEFLCGLFDVWKESFRDGVPQISVRWFDSVFATYVGADIPECTLLPECGTYVVVEHNGDVYACDFFVDPEWRLGNVLEGSLVDFLNSPRQNAFGRRKSKRPPECRTCRWLPHCHGGCPKDRMGDPRDNGSNHFCKSYQMFFEHANADLRRLAKQWLAYQGLRPASQAPTTPPPETDSTRKAGRNDPCPCGSGKKYKHCCLNK
ncbi:MAG: anaerobic sulfatase maturase [bacterium]